jgi:cell division inhibitor SepF
MKVNLKKWLTTEEEGKLGSGDNFYNVNKDAFLGEDGSSKMILLEPRAYSEASQIVDFLKQRNTVVVNLKRVTKDQAKRIIDFLSGTIYAIDGKIEKIGGGIFLCTPNNVNIQGQITDENEGKDIHNNNDINLEW